MNNELANLQNWRYREDAEKIAWLGLNCAEQSANTLNRATLEEWRGIVDYLSNNHTRLKGVVIYSAQTNGFCFGANIHEFDMLTDNEACRALLGRVNDTLERFERLPIPTIALINGICLGGGLELALACKFRIAEPDAKMGFPEVKLGIFPGFGGTVRSTRLINPVEAMTLMLTGRTINARKARALGLVDKVSSASDLMRWQARKMLVSNRLPKRSKGWMNRLQALGFVRSRIADKMRVATSAKANPKHYPAPFALIDLWEKHGGNGKRMAYAESEAFTPLMIGSQSMGLRHLYKVSEQIKKAPKNRGKCIATKRVHVIGAGTMGGDIAAWCALNNLETSISDTDSGRLAAAIKRADKLFKKKCRAPDALQAARGRLIADKDWQHLQRCDLIIEAVVEKLEVKQEIFAKLEATAKADAILATNTSSIPLEDIANGMKKASRLVGIHFFNPVAQMQLVEIVQGAKTSLLSINSAHAFIKSIKKLPLIVKSQRGFLVNRVLIPYMLAALEEMGSGTSKEQIDHACKDFGMPMGPIELADVVGIDICLHVAMSLGMEADQHPSGAVLQEKIAAGNLGRKSGQGFYQWEGGKAKRSAYTPEGNGEELALKLLKPLFDECNKCLEEGIVGSENEIDAGVVFGTGFAPFHGGPMNYQRSLEDWRGRT